MTGADALDKEAAAYFAGRMAFYRTLVAAIKRISLELLNTAKDRHRIPSSNGEMFFESRETRIN